MDNTVNKFGIKAVAFTGSKHEYDTKSKSMYLRAKFSIIEDERHQGYIDHKLTDVLIIIMLSVICGLDELADIMIFAQKKRIFLEEKCGIKEIPSKPTMSRILNMINGSEVAKVIIEIMKERSDILGDIIAVA